MSSTFTMIYKGGRIRKAYDRAACFYNINYADKILQAKGFKYEEKPLEKIVFYPTPSGHISYAAIEEYYIFLKHMWKGVLEFKDFPDALCNGIHISAHHPRDIVLAALSTCRSPTERPSVPIIFKMLKTIHVGGLRNTDRYLLAQMFKIRPEDYLRIGDINVRDLRQVMDPTAHTPTLSIGLSVNIFKKFRAEFPFKSNCKSLSEEPKIGGIQTWFSGDTNGRNIDDIKVCHYMGDHNLSTLGDLIDKLSTDRLI